MTLLACQLPVYYCNNDTTYLISPFLNDSSCPIGNCLTFSQFFTLFARLDLSRDIDVTLTLLPGNHSLELDSAHLTNLTSVTVTGMISPPLERGVWIVCSESARLFIGDVDLVHIGGVKISGCKLITADSIKQVLLYNVQVNNSTFHIVDITDVGIRDCAFSNSQGIDRNSTGTIRRVGGVLVVFNSTILIANSTFENNRADLGGAFFVEESDITLDESQFQNNFATFDGGAIYLLESNLIVNCSNFSNNTVETGRAPGAYGLGGVIYAKDGNISLQEGNVFISNKADVGGVIFSLVLQSHISTDILDISEHCHVYISNNKFVNNQVLYEGSVMFAYGCQILDSGSIFEYNIINDHQPLEGTFGGVISSTFGYITLNRSAFIGNSALLRASTFALINGKMNSYNMLMRDNWSEFYSAEAISEGIMIISRSEVIFHGETYLLNNSGTMYIYNSNVTFSGETSITNCTQLSGSEFGGGISADSQSIVQFHGRTILTNNHAVNGGAVNARESQVYFFGEASLSGNTAEQAGGAIFLLQSEMTCQGNCTIENNSANKTGGGIHAIRSSIRAVVKLSNFLFFNPHMVPVISLNFVGNKAKRGGGLSLQSNSKFYAMLLNVSSNGIISFTNNTADSDGGAIYVADETYFDTCSTTFDHECFFQPTPLRTGKQSVDFTLKGFVTSDKVFEFSGNSATRGPLLYGGLLDRCMLNRTLQTFTDTSVTNAFQYFTNISSSSTSLLSEVSSEAVRVCFCRDGRSDCSYQHPVINVTKGEAFTITVAAVDHVNHTVTADIITSLSPRGGLSEGQQHQRVKGNCTTLTFNVQSPYDMEHLVMYTDGPCKDLGLSRTEFAVNFSKCTCPIGFQPLKTYTTCACDCDPAIHEYTRTCEQSTDSIVRENTNSWIAYDSQCGYTIHKHCPFDYCLPSTTMVRVSLTSHNGSDVQCNFNHAGVLCGECKAGYSLSFGSSKCMKCQKVKLIGGIFFWNICLKSCRWDITRRFHTLF